MNIKDIHDLVKQQRELIFAGSNQLSLGDLILEIEKEGVENDNGEVKEVCYDFGSAIPTFLSSWRGSYDELALGYTFSGYDKDGGCRSNEKADTLLEHLKSAVGEIYEGWKGGDFKMHEGTPIWVSNPGNVGNTGIVGVLNDGWRLVLITAYCEY